METGLKIHYLLNLHCKGIRVDLKLIKKVVNDLIPNSDVNRCQCYLLYSI